MASLHNRRGWVAAFFLTFSLFLPQINAAQSFSAGADVVSRYIWRGIDFGETMSVQPGLAFEFEGLTVGAWASYSIAQDGSGANENDLYLSYSLGPVSIGVTDYYFPSPGGLSFFDFDGDGNGAHTVELNVGFGGTKNFPLIIAANMNLHNDPDNSIYVELGLPFMVEKTAVTASLGIVGAESDFYGVGQTGITVIGLSASREIKITDHFSLPVFVSYILNPTPDNERSFLVFGFSL